MKTFIKLLRVCIPAIISMVFEIIYKLITKRYYQFKK